MTKSGTTKATGRNYKKEYSNYQGKPEQKKRRAQRNKARRIMVSKGKASKGDGKDVSHKNPNVYNNSSSNLKMEEPSVNRREPRLRGKKKKKTKKND